MFPELKNLFYTDASTTFLNYGSFGSTPKPILEKQFALMQEMESNPVQFIKYKAAKYLQVARKRLGDFVGCSAEDIVFVTNPSYAVNVVAKSLHLQKDDEVLTTNLEYGACDKTWNYYCTKAGAKYVQANITLPITTKEKFLEEFFSDVNSNTKLIFISHITSATALVLPVQEICDKAKSLGISVFIDGAHAPGHVHLNIQELDCDYYTGACHKWMLAPKGCSFLFAKKSVQNQIDPLIISWGFDNPSFQESQFIDYHQFNGTRDLTAFITLPYCIDFMQEQNWNSISNRCKEIVLQFAPRIIEAAQSHAIAPLSAEWFGQMISIPIACKQPENLQHHLYNTHHIEIPITTQNNAIYLRYSFNAMNTSADLKKLESVLLSNCLSQFAV
jgi:isopenicillin-N epimerase